MCCRKTAEKAILAEKERQASPDEPRGPLSPVKRATPPRSPIRPSQPVSGDQDGRNAHEVRVGILLLTMILLAVILFRRNRSVVVPIHQGVLTWLEPACITCSKIAATLSAVQIIHGCKAEQVGTYFAR